ncbi:hypothetical protein FRB90_008827, partial [Tulasnella sp. 427]
MEAIADLLEKKAFNFADRQRFTMLNELLGLGGYLTFNGHNSIFKAQRALLKQPLSAPVVKKDYRKILEVKSREYLERCFNRPDNFLSEGNAVVGEAIIQITYGRLKDDKGTDYIRVNEHVEDILIAGLEGYVVDLIPA